MLCLIGSASYVQSEVSSIRSNDHRQLHEAVPTASESQFALGLRDVGRRNDFVYWMGVRKTDLQ